MPYVKSGLDLLLEKHLRRFAKMRLGILCHQASVDSRLRHAIDLLKARDVQLTALFAPEHGFWGMAQDQIAISGAKHPVYGVPVFSLYGERRGPQRQSLLNIDAMICDLQDAGSRYYTFVWTMALAMQACARYGKKFVVLDRPNPLGGVEMEGPLLDPRFASFVGLYPVPVRHGLTIGELALWLNGSLRIGADLEVIRMSGWKRRMAFEETGLPWVMPSPNMPTVDTAFVYPGMCLIEGTNLSEGRGTTRPFEIIGAPFVNPDSLARLLNSEKIPGVTFRSCRFQPTFHKYRDEPCGGVQLHVRDRRIFKPFLTGLKVIARIYDLYPRLFAWRNPPYEFEQRKLPFDILCGTDRIRRTIKLGGRLGDLERGWQKGLAAFAKERKQYLLYD
jgi:uncharacterized protein YbbC (DUF1343 family)